MTSVLDHIDAERRVRDFTKLSTFSCLVEFVANRETYSEPLVMMTRSWHD